jgi:[acyl-carrier-protein] S-malonyltransferase
LIEKTCQELQGEGKFVVPANYNCSSQIVISGNKEAVEECIKILKENGARKIIQLKTSGPFHTKKLSKAKELYSKELEDIKFNTENIEADVIKNIDGTLYNKNDDFKTILSNHIVSSVRFDKAIELMKKEQVTKFIEIGPGKTMSNLIKKDFKDENIEIYQTDNLENLSLTIENLK